ncbi:nucleoside kinase [Candidatus Poribacteria bacterium]|nr:nucleoside kinase [Candidatus Poribacteria bacterium]
MAAKLKETEKKKSGRKPENHSLNGNGTAKTVQITLPDGSKRRVPINMRAGDLLAEANLPTPFPAVAVRFRNKIASFERPLDRSGELAPVHLGTRDGALIYRRSLTFVLIRAVRELFPDLRVHINHSLDQGYYGELFCEQYRSDGPVVPIEADILAIEKRMREIVSRDEKIERNEYPLAEAKEIFRAEGMLDKVELLQYSAPGTVSIYRMGNSVNHFYGQLAPSTGCLSQFEVRLTPPGFVLRFPTRSKPSVLPPYHHQVKILGVLKEYERWLQILEWRTVANLNELIDAGRVREYVLIAEALHEKRIAAIADAITDSSKRPRIVLLSGPSSSGKTTSIKRLAIQLRVNGHRPLVVGLDDFFVDREDTPRDEKGEFDFEAFHAINVKLLQESVRGLLRGEAVRMPKFSFQQGRGFPGEEVRLQEGQILILEGIHALNDELLPTVPEGLKFKIYASPLTHLNIDDHNRIASSDVRLLRRLVRDFNYRGYDAVDTLRRWPSVRRGEERNIFPYQENADVIFNSSLPYELAVLKTFAVGVLKRVKREHEEFSEAARLIKFLSYFREIEPDLVPRHSLLREFIGGSCFTY